MLEQVAYRGFLGALHRYVASHHGIACQVKARLDLLHDLAQLILATGSEQVADRLRHAFEDERNQQYWQACNVEHPLPAISLDQLLGGECHQDPAYRIARENQGNQASTQLEGRVFTHLRSTHRQYATDAQACNEARDAEADRVVGQARHCGEDAEQRHTDGDHARPADAVGQCTEEYRTQHGAQQSRARHDAGAGGVDIHVLHDRWQCRADHGKVIAVDDQNEHTPEQDAPMKTIEL
ncbi:hypothetical protein D3C77_238410 [compost metagenome]